MKEVKRDIWDAYDNDPACVVCITTNVFVKKNGQAVMGRGTAAQAAKRWPSLPRLLGNRIRANGNVVQVIAPRLLAFPVKPVSGISDGQNVVRHTQHRFPKGSTVPGWAMKADPDIIRESLAQLARIRQHHGRERVFLPRPGCGAGELDWETQVKPLCQQYGNWLHITHL